MDVDKEIEVMLNKSGAALVKADTSAVVDTLRGLYQQKGHLDVDDALSHAANPESPLHDLLEWDDTIAGAKYRRFQMLEIIRRVKIHIIRPDEPPRAVRMFVSRPSMRGVGYEHIEEVMADPNKKEELLRSALNDLRAFQKRYELLAELTELFWEIDKTVDLLTPKVKEKKSA